MQKSFSWVNNQTEREDIDVNIAIINCESCPVTLLFCLHLLPPKYGSSLEKAHKTGLLNAWAMSVTAPLIDAQENNSFTALPSPFFVT